MGVVASQITSLGIVYSTVNSGAIKGNIKALRHWPLCEEFTGDRWIPRTKGQWRGKCFHLMTSSWTVCQGYWAPGDPAINSSPPGKNGRHFGRRQFQMHFLEWKWHNSDSISTEICFQESNWQYPSIGSGNGLAPNRRQVITWTNADLTLHMHRLYKDHQRNKQT